MRCAARGHVDVIDARVACADAGRRERAPAPRRAGNRDLVSRSRLSAAAADAMRGERVSSFSVVAKPFPRRSGSGGLRRMVEGAGDDADLVSPVVARELATSAQTLAQLMSSEYRNADLECGGSAAAFESGRQSRRTPNREPLSKRHVRRHANPPPAAKRLHKRQLRSGHVVEAGQQLRLHSAARSPRRADLPRSIAPNDAIKRSYSRPGAPDDDLDARAALCTGARTRSQGQAAVPNVAIGPFEHRRDAAALPSADGRRCAWPCASPDGARCPWPRAELPRKR